MVLEDVPMKRGATIEEIAVGSMQDAGFRITSGSRQTINGLEAYVGVYQGQLQNIGSVTMRVAHIVHNASVYMVGGLSAPNLFEQSDGTYLASIRTFKPLSAAEAEAIHPNRIDIYVVRQGDSWQSIADRSGGVIKPSTLAIMNGAAPSSQPTVGTRIKIVVGG